ncbi:DUF72 domain-containing protein [Ramlibacter algicola]|uniref:DUF72 domain-containing protein n=1 Tax=Ramlibacter algicola TaxID=2795217 RepID=A0A934USA0_9BURK|nr:DUF72 domain-containing protein [Ramlibacter algicola]MBK0393337.1 DUF72 domain-containing protein [Ramlibacter algicola]
MAGKVWIGVSGWRYEPWRGNFYPTGLAQSRELHHASRQFNSIELNGSFYSLQRPGFYAQWAAQTPPGFLFAVKGGRYITHMLKLRNADTALGNFFASGVFALGDKLGPILWQFPPQVRLNLDLFEQFFSALPKDTTQAAQVARWRDQRLEGRELLDPPVKMKLRHCVEVRHDSFVDAAFIALLRKYNVAWVVADTPRPWPLYEDVTADFVYMRLHGSTELYNSRYTPEEIERWAACIDAWRQGREPADARLITRRSPGQGKPLDVYCYFDNTDKLHAPDNARELMALLGVRAPKDG